MADEEDIVIASSGITIDKFEEKIAFVKKRNLPFCMNTSTIRFKVDRNLLIDRFLYYFLMTNKFKKQIGAQATGSAQLNFGPSHLEKVMIDVPNSKDEQTAIATTLSDMDSEIEKLENKLSKYRQIKTGMMQQLLTGKIRLVKN
jgi:type I restriction enzyme S subunit